MAKGKGGKGGKGGKSPLAGLSSIVGKEKLKLAQQIAANPEAVAYYNQPTEAEKYYNTAGDTLKSDAQIAQEQAAAFDMVRRQAETSKQSGQNLTQAFTSALGSATGGLSGLAGGNAAAMLGLMQGGESQAAGAGAYGAGISSMAGTQLLEADIQQAIGTAQAKAARDAMYQDMKQKAIAAKDARLQAKMGLKATEKGNIISALSNLFTLSKAAGAGSSSGKSGSGGTTPVTIPGAGDGSVADTAAALASMAVTGSAAHAGLRGRGSKGGSKTTSTDHTTAGMLPFQRAEQAQRQAAYGIPNIGTAYTRGKAASRGILRSY